MPGGQCAVVTGANSGIGTELAAGLYAQGLDVVMASRNMGKCEDCKADLQQAGHANATGGSLTCEQLDLEDYVSIRRFSKRLSSRLAEQKRPLSVLVNNAGVMGVKGTVRCPDQHLRPNVYGPFLLQQLLLPMMAPDGRIVNLASRAHKHTRRLQFDKTTGQLSHHPWHWYWQYSRSKLCNVMLTGELQRRLRQAGSRIQAYAVSPGLVATSILDSAAGPLKVLVQPVIRCIAKTPAQGAETPLYAATAADIPHGSLYLHDCKPVQPSSAASDPEQAQQLWRACCEEVQLSAKGLGSPGEGSE